MEEDIEKKTEVSKEYSREDPKNHMREHTEYSMLEEIRDVFGCEGKDIRTFSPLSLAFLGDGVYSVMVRTLVVEQGNRPAEKLHEETRDLVSAKAQAKIADAIQDLLTKEELLIYKRGHNASPEHHAKSATMDEYLKATALETLCGYLYLMGRTRRFLELLKTGLERTKEEQRNEDNRASKHEG